MCSLMKNICLNSNKSPKHQRLNRFRGIPNLGALKIPLVTWILALVIYIQAADRCKMMNCATLPLAQGSNLIWVN